MGPYNYLGGFFFLGVGKGEAVWGGGRWCLGVCTGIGTGSTSHCKSIMKALVIRVSCSVLLTLFCSCVALLYNFVQNRRILWCINQTKVVLECPFCMMPKKCPWYHTQMNIFS